MYINQPQPQHQESIERQHLFSDRLNPGIKMAIIVTPTHTYPSGQEEVTHASLLQVIRSRNQQNIPRYQKWPAQNIFRPKRERINHVKYQYTSFIGNLGPGHCFVEALAAYRILLPAHLHCRGCWRMLRTLSVAGEHYQSMAPDLRSED